MSVLMLCALLAFQEPAVTDQELDQSIQTANEIFEGLWPSAVQMIEKRMNNPFSEMDDADEFIRKFRITKLNLNSPPKLERVKCKGDPDCQRVRFSIPGKGKWSVKVAGEIVPPWQRNKNKWRKLRLGLKDISLSQEYDVVRGSDGSVRLEPAGVPEFTFRVTSPNLIYRAVLAAAQRFMGDSMKEMFAEEIMNELPLAEMALTKLGGLDMKNMVADLSDRMDDQGDFFDDQLDPGEPITGSVAWIPLDGPRELTEGYVGEPLDDDAFSVNFVEKDLDFYAESFTAEVNVNIPPGTEIEDVTFKLGSQEIAKLTAPPYRIDVTPNDDSQVLLATVTLKDGIQEDDYLYIEGRGHIEEMEVEYINVPVNFPENSFTIAEIAAMRPELFQLTEEGVDQKIINMMVARDRPIELQVLMDMSGSMEGPRLKRAKEAAVGFVDHLFQKGDSLRLIAFSNRIKVGPSFSDKKDMMRAIRNLNRPKGGTYSFDAVNTALGKFENPDALHVILLLTDGFNSGGKTKWKQLVRRLQNSNALLYSVGIDVRRDRNIKSGGFAKDFTPNKRPSLVHLQDLYDMAKVTGGRPFFVDNPSWLSRAFAEIDQDLRNQLSIGYVSNLPKHQKGWRKIDISYLPQKDLSLRHKERYWKE